MSALDEILAQLAAARNGLTPGQPAPAAVQQNPLGTALQQLQSNFQTFAQQHGGQGEPLADRKGASLITGSGTDATNDPLTKALSTVAQVNLQQGSDRAGQGFQAYDLADGRRAHVYYDKKGKRRVFVFRPNASAAAVGTGGVEAPA